MTGKLHKNAVHNLHYGAAIFSKFLQNELMT